MLKRECGKEVGSDGAATILSHHNKTMHTLRVLMRLLGIELHFKRIHEQWHKTFTVDCVVMLISRCRKMYEAVQHLVTIFKLTGKLAQTNGNLRLMTSIKTFLQEHTLFPVGFTFGGVDLLLKLNKL